MPRRSRKIESFDVVDRITGEMSTLRVQSSSEPDYAYGFAGKKFSMVAHELWTVALRSGFLGVDYELLGVFINLQTRAAPGRILYKSQKELGGLLGVAQSKVSVSMKKMREARIIYPIHRSAVMLNPQFVYCGTGKDHGDALKEVPLEHVYRRDPDPSRKAA